MNQKNKNMLRRLKLLSYKKQKLNRKLLLLVKGLKMKRDRNLRLKEELWNRKKPEKKPNKGRILSNKN